MSREHKTANQGWEEGANRTTQSSNTHGLSKGQRLEKTKRNRAAKRKVKKEAFQTET